MGRPKTGEPAGPCNFGNPQGKEELIGDGDLRIGQGHGTELRHAEEGRAGSGQKITTAHPQQSKAC